MSAQKSEVVVSGKSEHTHTHWDTSKFSVQFSSVQFLRVYNSSGQCFLSSSSLTVCRRSRDSLLPRSNSPLQLSLCFRRLLSTVHRWSATATVPSPNSRPTTLNHTRKITHWTSVQLLLPNCRRQQAS